MTSLPLRIAAAALRRPIASPTYGDHPRQEADLYKPLGLGALPVAVVLHGGYWQAPYTKLITVALCQDLVRRGWAVYNVGYRRLGRDGGGWPQTFDDVARAIDSLATLGDRSLDLDRVTLVGHSAGGLLALWAGGRPQLPPDALGARPRVAAQQVLALAPVTDLARAGRIATALMGGAPDEVPERWAQADPIRHGALEIPVGLVHCVDDETIAVQRSRDYAAVVRAAGADITLIESPGGHRDPIDPATAAWRAAAAWL